MAITREFLLSEISRFENDRAQAQAFIASSEIAILAYQALIDRIDAPEPEPKAKGVEHDDAN